MRQDGMIGLRRRGLLTGAAAGALGLALPAHAAGQLNVAAYGGVINDYLTKDFGAPFEQKTGIKVNFGTGASLALAKLQVAAGCAVAMGYYRADRLGVCRGGSSRT